MMSLLLGQLSSSGPIVNVKSNLVRLSKNTSESVDMETRCQIVDGFYERLRLSGYGHEQSVKIITSGLTGYERIRRNADRSGGNINRCAAEGAEERHRKKLLGKTNWFKGKSDEEREKKRGVKNKIKNKRDGGPTGLQHCVAILAGWAGFFRGGLKGNDQEKYTLEVKTDGESQKK